MSNTIRISDEHEQFSVHYILCYMVYSFIFLHLFIIHFVHMYVYVFVSVYPCRTTCAKFLVEVGGGFNS